MTSLKAMYKEYKWLWFMCALAGVVVGLASYTVYVSRAWSYISDDPAACVNCHIMGPYYQSWSKSSHAVWSTCNDCHLPQENIIRKYAFKAMDGLYHSALFTLGAESQVIRPRDGSYEVILQNCLRCHTPLVTEFTKMNIDYKQVLAGETKACWDCHTQVPHTNISNLASVSGVGSIPFPDSPVPEWLGNLLNNQGDKP
ncbi:MAG: cytochrome c nitrite reductase small subunit [Deltaproteobacteria bacterium]|nr:cytochrome c nitrite reductase small subunit [Deltaproteobacteria bacterium]